MAKSPAISGSKKKFSTNGKYSKELKDSKNSYFNSVIALVFFVILTCLSAYILYHYNLLNRVITPHPAPKVILQNASAMYNSGFYWGSYRPGVYFGMKTLHANSPVFGLMWMQEFTGKYDPPIRHWCEQGDSLGMYSWFAHDGKQFGLQSIIDHYYTIRTEFLKRPGGNHGGDWSARISVDPKQGAEKAVVSLFFYAALEGHGTLEAVNENSRISHIKGFTEELGDFVLKFPSETNVKKFNYLVTYADSLSELKETMVKGFRLADYDRKLHNSKYFALSGVKIPENRHGNFIVYQVTVELPFQMYILFESGSFIDRKYNLIDNVYEENFARAVANFDSRFEEIFRLNEKGYSPLDVNYAKAALSNMLGGIGFFSGSSIVSSQYDPTPKSYWDAALYSAVPSRSFFPRGFLWDEGFHNLLISKWNKEITKDIIGHWFDLLNADGWIPREQILGSEARSKVPAEFVVQHDRNANPPTFFLTLQSIINNMMRNNDGDDIEYLKRLYPRLVTWYSWFNVTQIGPLPFTYQWKGRNPNSKQELNPKTLTSGLDDYPRASHPSVNEYHVDLRCWMAVASEVMANIAKKLGEPYDDYLYTYNILRDNKLLDELHWSDDLQMFADYGLHTEFVKLKRPPMPKKTTPGQYVPRPDKERFVEKEPANQHVKQYGYVSLFPFLLRLLDADSPKLGRILNDLNNTNLLWTPYGLRSLAKTSSLYNKRNTEHDPPYWRGNIWININYLAVSALYHYSSIDGPHQKISYEHYTNLRNNLISNILNQFKVTGYVWENYNDLTGKGQGCHPFTGWSALFVALMAEQY